jgi:penicillin-binding protein 1A
MFYYFSGTIPAIGPLLKGYDPPQTTRILASDGTIIGELFSERRTVVDYKRIPKVMINAVIAAEDADFRQHEGLDYPGMVRAIVANLTTGKRAQGASTITQQVARTFFLTREKTYTRKIREILLTKRIEERLSKDEILFLYLNQINFGHARYGVSEASRYYFNKPITQLSLADAALLAGIPKGPALFSPITHPEAARSRRSYVLGEMVKNGMVSRQRADRARRSSLGVLPTSRLDSSLAPEAVSQVLAELSDTISISALQRGGFTIETTLDARLQRSARKAVTAGLISIDSRHKRVAPFKTRKRWPKGNRGKDGNLREGRTYVGKVIRVDKKRERLEIQVGSHKGFADLRRVSRYNPNKVPLTQFASPGAKLHVSLASPKRQGKPLSLQLEIGPQAALVALNPSTGSIAAMIGGDDARPAGFNRATAAYRQPGSVFKPFVYLAALRTRRYTPATLIDDSPVVLGKWQPQNSHPDDYAGAVRLRTALAKSLNLPAVKLIGNIGPETVVKLVYNMGIESKLEATPALALGSSAVSPLEIAAAYSVIVNGGKKQKPWIVKRVVGPDGSELPLLGRVSEQVITPDEAYLTTSLLRSVVTTGTGGKARRLERPVGGKTGTSNQQRDAWFAGFTTDLVCAVWVGYDDFRSIGRKEYGSRAALPIWLDFMIQAHSNIPKRDFDSPPGIVSALIDPTTGLLAYEGLETAFEELFLEGTEPTATAVPPDLVSPADFLYDQITDDAGPKPSTVSDAGIP